MWNIKIKHTNSVFCAFPDVESIILVSCDSNYFDLYFESLLASLAIWSPGENLLLRVINPTEKQVALAHKLKERYFTINLSFSFAYVDFFCASREEVLSYFACDRFLFLNEIKSIYSKKIFVIDVDAVFLGGIRSLWSRYDGIDISAYVRPSRSISSRRILSGAVFFDLSKEAVGLLIENLVKKISFGNPVWYIDQISLYEVLMESGDIVFSPLEFEFIDYEFSENSIIWTGKGERKINNEKYIQKIKYIFECSSIFDQIQNGVFSPNFQKFQSENTEKLLNCIYKFAEERLVVSSGSCGILQFDNPSIDKDLGHFSPLPQRKFSGFPRPILFSDIFRRKNSNKKTESIVGRLRRRFNAVKSFLILCAVPSLSADYFRARSVAVVGNSKALINKGYGDEIDRHDIVIRFNLGYPFTVKKEIVTAAEIPSSFNSFLDARVSPPERHYFTPKESTEEKLAALTNVKDIGRRTDIWVCATVDSARQSTYKNLFDARFNVWPHPTTYANIILALLDRRLRIIDPHFFFECKDNGFIPSSGLIMAKFLSQFVDIENVDFYGFDFFQNGHVFRSNELLLRKIGKFPHNGALEKTIFLDLIENNSKFRLR